MKSASPISFRDRLVVRLTLVIVGVAVLSLLLTFALNLLFFSLEARSLSPELREVIERSLREDLRGETDAVLYSLAAAFRNTQVRSTLASIVLSGALWLLLAVLVARAVARPVEAVTLAAARISSGDLQARVGASERSVGEMALLVTHFNEMAAALEAYERERTEMIAAIAHELRTPLAVMAARLEVLADGLVDFSPEEVERLRRQVALITRLVGDLRTLSLADAGKLSLHKRDTDLLELARTTVTSLEPRAAEGGVALTVHGASVWACVDPDRMAQVLYNLLDNALRHTPSGGRVGVGRVAEGVRLSVRDTGPGFEGAPERLFERFYTTAEAGTEISPALRAGGTGLGLALVKALAERHGGRVTARQGEEGGAVFEVEVPAREAEADGVPQRVR